jgi:serine/threonine protein phosphatase PrpC
MREQIEKALKAYGTGDLKQAKSILCTLTNRPDVTDDNAEEMIKASMASNDEAARAWIDLAINKIEREQGLDNNAVIPVPLALNTALDLIKREERKIKREPYWYEG